MIKLEKPVLTKSRIRLFIVYLLIFLCASFLGNIWMTRHQVDGPVPSIATEDLNGRSFKFDNSQQENPKLLYFFADWCPICKIQNSVISAISEDFDVVGIAMASGDSKNVTKYVTGQNIDFTVINDENSKISQSFGVNGVPAVFVINRQGDIQFSTRGYATEAGLRSRIWLAEKN